MTETPALDDENGVDPADIEWAASIRLQLMPINWKFGAVDTPMGRLTVVGAGTPLGEFTFLMTPEEGQRLGGMMRAAGKQAGTNLVVPSGLVLPGQ